MKSVALSPFCPLPADTGGKTEIWKHLTILRELGPCRIVSAATRPVGGGWTRESRERLESLGFEVVLREDSLPHWTPAQWAGMAYGSACKGLGLERAFPHANPYHRYAFPVSWWRRVSESADLALINYSYWCWLPCEMPKAMALHDLWSHFMWGGTRLETREIAACDHVFVISQSEIENLRQRGIQAVSWCPPAIKRSDPPRRATCAMLGSANRFNREGLRWLEGAGALSDSCGIRVYGALAGEIRDPGLIAVGRYRDNDEPFRENGVALFATVLGMGVQIKTIEALASGRAIVARRGAIRGLPPSEGAWIEVDTPAEAIEWVRRLRDDPHERDAWGAKAHAFYDRHLSAQNIRTDAMAVYRSIVRGSRLPS